MKSSYNSIAKIKTKQSNLIKKWAEDLHTHFYKDMQIVNRYIRRCSISLIISEMQIKTTMRYYLTPVTMVLIKKMRDSKCW